MDEKRKLDYDAAMHGVQSGVAMEIERCGLDDAAANPKQLRVGVNAAMVDSAALASLLIKKGIITKAEYQNALTEEANRELDRYEERINSKLGTENRLKLR